MRLRVRKATSYLKAVYLKWTPKAIQPTIISPYCAAKQLKEGQWPLKIGPIGQLLAAQRGLWPVLNRFVYYAENA